MRILLSYLLVLSCLITANAKPLSPAEIERLGNPSDSLHNEQLYLNALEHALSDQETNDNLRLRYELLLESARKNRMDSAANDITFSTPENNEYHLSDFLGTDVLIFFNDPDCESCDKVKKRIDSSELLRRLTAEKKLIIVGIYPFGDEELWRRTVYPEIMINGWNRNGEITDNETYDIPLYPIFYLIDAQGKVVLKNEPSLKRVEQQLSSLFNP